MKIIFHITQRFQYNLGKSRAAATRDWLQARLTGYPAMCTYWNIAKFKTLYMCQIVFSIISSICLQHICKVLKWFNESCYFYKVKEKQ